MQGTYKSSWNDKILAATENDIDSKLGTDYRINPELKRFVPRPQVIVEYWLRDIERDLIHFRLSWADTNNIPRLERLCCCGTNRQNPWHVFSECPLTIPLIDTSYPDLQPIFLDEKVHQHLLIRTKKLKIPIGMI